MKLTAENTAIVLDSTADFPDARERFPNFRIVPLYVRFGDESFRDYVEITPDRFYERLQTDPELPTTSQPTPGDFLAAYEELAPHYERILSIQISSTLSGTFASAQTAAEMLGGDKVRVIDSRTVAASLALLAIGVQARLERGTTDEEVDAFVARYQREHHLLFTVSTLDYLARGGRIGRAAALAGNLLEREADPHDPRRRGDPAQARARQRRRRSRSSATLFESTTTDVAALKVGIAHAAAPERLEALRALVEHVRPHAADRDRDARSAPSSARTPGPGTVGFFWFDDA